MHTFIKRRANLSLSGGLRLGIVIVLLIVAGTLLSQGAGATSASSPTVSGDLATSTQAPAQKAAPAPISVTAYALYAAYDQNPLSADAKYKGKLVDVTGIVGSIGKDILDHPYVTLKTDAYSEDVQCSFPDSAIPELTKLSSGQSVTLEGTVTGETLTLVGVDGCSVVSGQ